MGELRPYELKLQRGEGWIYKEGWKKLKRDATISKRCMEYGFQNLRGELGERDETLEDENHITYTGEG